jgi:hypothetical protein
VCPEDLVTVVESWAELRLHTEALADRLAASYRVVLSPQNAEQRARWLVIAVAELVGLLTAPSQLAARARDVAATLPQPSSTPTFVLDGNAWMIAAREVSAYWSDCMEGAWRHAWLLLSEALANESLSPFTRSQVTGS